VAAAAGSYTKPVTTWSCAFTAIGSNPTRIEPNVTIARGGMPSKYDPFDHECPGLKEWLREIRIEKLLSRRNKSQHFKYWDEES
jgi:hypothetical protein